jgi:hypothetical protein
VAQQPNQDYAPADEREGENAERDCIWKCPGDKLSTRDQGEDDCHEWQGVRPGLFQPQAACDRTNCRSAKDDHH